MLSVLRFSGYPGNKGRQSGFTLLEVLVAIVVLSIGLLGLAGLMATSLRNNQSAYHRSQAVLLAYDISERMRANRPAALTNAYDITIGTAAPAGTDMAATDIAEWKAILARSLPAGDGAVSVTASTRRVTITVQWNDARGTQGSTAHQFQTQTQL